MILLFNNLPPSLAFIFLLMYIVVPLTISLILLLIIITIKKTINIISNHSKYKKSTIDLKSNRITIISASALVISIVIMIMTKLLDICSYSCSTNIIIACCLLYIVSGIWLAKQLVLYIFSKRM